MTALKLKRLSAAVALLAGSHAAHALVPWTTPVPAANVFYISGGAAQDSAFSEVIKNNLAEPGTLDTFGDATTTTSTNWGARWTAYYFTGKSTLSGGLAGQPIVVVKRSLGAAGYGVVPVIANLPLEELNISGLTGVDGTSVLNEGANKYRVVVTSANAASRLTLVPSDAGILGTDAKLLLKPGSVNYPAPVARVGAGSDVFPTTINSVPSNFTQLNTGGQVYGVGVTTDFYKVLQAAQKIAGTINPATIGDYTNENDLPSLNRNFVGSLIAGKIQAWDQVKVVAKTTAGGAVIGQSYALTDPVVTGLAGVTLPTTIAAGANAGKVPVAVGNRNAGAAIGAVAYSVFLNYPWTAGAASPAAGTNNAFEATAAPLVKLPGGTTATGNLLDDWNQGTNTSGLNNVANAKRWGIAINTADPNGSGTIGVNPEDVGKKHFRYIRIDGYAPTIENVAAGGYPHWAEGVLLYNTTTTGADPAAVGVLTAIASGLASPATAATVNQALVHTWGQPGIFGLTANGAVQSIPYSDANPVVAYSHKPGAAVLDEVVPVISGAAGGVLLK